MRALTQRLPRWRLLAAAAILFSTGAFALSAADASASPCSDIVCGQDFSAVQGVQFSGQVGTFVTVAGCPADGHTYTATIDWGDGTPTTAGVLDIPSPCGGGTFGAINGTHTYAQPSTYTVTLTLVVDGAEQFGGTAQATVRQAVADLGVSLSAPAAVKTGSTLVYLINVVNAGSEAARNVVLSDQLPYGTSYQAVTASGWSCAAPAVGTLGGTVRCTVDPLISGASVATSIAVKVKAKPNHGVITDSVRVSSDTFDPNTSDNLASVSTSVGKR